MPELVEAQHLSLLPHISRFQAAHLRARGIERWPQMAEATDEQLQSCHFEPHQLRQLDVAVDHLKKGDAVTRFPLRSSLLAGLTPISLEFSSFGQQQPDEPLRAVALWYEDATGPARIPLRADGRADLSVIADRSSLAVYGGREMGVTCRLLRESGTVSPRCVDLLDLVENVVHAPVLGLELAQMVQFVNPDGSTPHNTGERVLAMRAILDWMTGNLRAVA